MTAILKEPYDGAFLDWIEFLKDFRKELDETKDNYEKDYLDHILSELEYADKWEYEGMINVDE